MHGAGANWTVREDFREGQLLLAVAVRDQLNLKTELMSAIPAAAGPWVGEESPAVATSGDASAEWEHWAGEILTAAGERRVTPPAIFAPVIERLHDHREWMRQWDEGRHRSFVESRHEGAMYAQLVQEIQDAAGDDAVPAFDLNFRQLPLVAAGSWEVQPGVVIVSELLRSDPGAWRDAARRHILSATRSDG